MTALGIDERAARSIWQHKWKDLIDITGTTRQEDKLCRCDPGKAGMGAWVEASGLRSSAYGDQTHSINSIAKRNRYPPIDNPGLLAAA